MAGGISGSLDRETLASLQAPTATAHNLVVPFASTWRRARSESHARRFVLAWLLFTLVVVPAGTLTRLMEWTGLPLHLGGETVFVTVYLPMLACVPVVLWFGFPWAAIPAYMSSFAVAAIGGMPWYWNLVFALSNPIALGVIALAYRCVPVTRNLRSSQSFLFFVLISFVSSIAGSLGAFVWARTNVVGLNDFYPVWQGWWLGGFLQSVLVCAPLLFLATGRVTTSIEAQGLSQLVTPPARRRQLLIPALLLLSAPLGFLLLNLRFSQANFESLLFEHPALVEFETELSNLLDGIALPLWCLIGFVGLTFLFGYRLGLVWEERYRSMARDLNSANEELARLALIDPLTGILNRAFFLESVERELRSATRDGRKTSCLMLDIDHFKQINDECGHLGGDDVLKGLAELLTSSLRQSDLVARFGGEEFVILLPSTPIDAALRLAENLRRSTEVHPFEAGTRTVHLTVSIGVAWADGESRDSMELLKAADRALYDAKRSGRNRVARADVGT